MNDVYDSGENNIFRKVWSVSVTRSSAVEPWGFCLEGMKGLVGV